MSVGGSSAPTRRGFTELLAEARARTILLVTPLSHEEISRQPDPAVESVLSELRRIVRFEAQLLLNQAGGYNPASYDEWFDTMMDVRQQVLEGLDQADAYLDRLSVGERYRMVLEYEYQRGEAILETLQMQGDPYSPIHYRELPRGRRLADPGVMARFPGGTVEIGADQASVWPEERPLHQVELEPFWIDLMPVTNGDYMTFMAAGGYESRDIWSEEGWYWVKESQARMPRHWTWQDGAWWSSWLGHDAPIDLTCPVSQVSFYEAEAFATFVGKRLPTEVEWETAAGWDPEAQTRRHYPWGNMPPTPNVANLDQLAFEPAAVGAFPGNVSPLGCYGMVGDLWEWTSSELLPYPSSGSDSTSAVPQPRFSTGSRVLRGGSWATRPGAIRISVRRPGAPEARHLFSGFRCARDA